jgi:hypothetical protein
MATMVAMITKKEVDFCRNRSYTIIINLDKQKEVKNERHFN